MNRVSEDSGSPTSSRAPGSLWDPYEVWRTRVRAREIEDSGTAALQAPVDRYTVRRAQGKPSGLAGGIVHTLPPLAWPVLLMALAFGLNRELVAIFRVDLVSLVFGVMTPAARVVHVLLGVSAICAAAMSLRLAGRRVSD